MTLPMRHGLFRTAMGGRDATLTEAFERLRRSPWRDSAAVPTRPSMFCGRVPMGNGGAWELINLDDEIYVVISDLDYPDERSETVVAEGFVEFHYTLAGTALAGDTKVDSLDLVVCRLGEQGRYTIHCNSGHRRSVAIYVRRAAFQRFLDPGAKFTPFVLEEIDQVGARQLYMRRIAMDLVHAQVANQLLYNPYHDGRRMLFVQMRVTELLCLSLDAWAVSAARRENGISLGPHDVRMLHAACQLIHTELSRSRTIESLAHKVGTNASKLKAGFRMLFSCTVFEFTTKVRMERALALLCEGQAGVAVVAHTVGYRHTSSFSSAFSKYYGLSPRQAKIADVVNRVVPITMPGTQPTRVSRHSTHSVM